MMTAALQILASVIGVVGAFLFTKLLLIPFLQKYQTWKDKKDTEAAIADSLKEQQNLDAEAAKLKAREESDFERLEREINKPKEPL